MVHLPHVINETQGWGVALLRSQGVDSITAHCMRAKTIAQKVEEQAFG